MSRDILHMGRAPSRITLNTSRNGASATSLDKLPHHSSKEFIPNVQAFWAAYPASHSPAPPIPSQQDCTWSVYCPACMDSEGCLTLVQHLALILVESHEVHMRPLLKLLQIPLGGILTSRSVSCTTQLVESWGVLIRFLCSHFPPAKSMLCWTAV